MHDILEFLRDLPWQWIFLCMATGIAALIATAPLVIGIIAQRKQNAMLDQPADRRIYENGQFIDVAEGNDLIKLDYSRADDECLVTVNLPWAVDPVHVQVYFKATDNPDRTGKNCASQTNSAPHDQWTQKNSTGGYVIYVYPGVRLSRVVIHLHPSGDQLELVFDQGWESRILFPLPPR